MASVRAVTVRVARVVERTIASPLIVLAYHRVASPSVDPWNLCVSADHFERQLECLAGAGDVPFDIDTCKLLRRYLGNPPRSLEIRPLPATPGE